MQIKPTRSPSLFWRTFLLLCGLIFFSVIGWLQSFRVLSELPYSQGIAQQIVSTANLSKYALISADPLYRTDLLRLLATREGLQISPREPTDKIEPIPDNGMNQLIEQLVKKQLGAETILANAVNDVHGLWVTVTIDGEEYWLQTRADLLDPPFGTTWLWWALGAALVSLFGATLLTQHVIWPLRRLSSFATQVGQGKTPPPLPEDEGTSEIQAVNRNFNHMVQDLRRMEADRELLLAGVSHDLRTPITRLRLEVELATLPEDSRQAMISDLAQMENIVDQFLSYARKSHENQAIINMNEALRSALSNTRLAGDETVELETEFAEDLCVIAHPLELTRAIQNLFTNAQRYGRSEDGILRLKASISRIDKKEAQFVVADKGPGVPKDQLARVMRPFERGESARSGATGTGLGLAIVERIVKRSGGRVELSANDPHGLVVRLIFPIATAQCQKKFRKELERGKVKGHEEKRSILPPYFGD